MVNRHLSRSIVMQTLFEWDFNGCVGDAEKILEKNQKEFTSEEGGFSFMKSLLKNVLSRKEDIDLIIEKAAPQWPIDQISIIDRNVLRIGLYELLFADRKEVPAKVAINEAIELSKKFGGEKSGKFVNGVLGAVYKEIGKPGFEEKGKEEKTKKDDVDIAEEDMEVEKLAGAVVYGIPEGGKAHLALVHDIFGYWTLSKGRIEKGEKPEDAAIREAKEELGIDVSIEMKLGENEYVSRHPQKKKFKKNVSYYLARASYKELEPKETSGLDDAKWFRLSDILNLKIYDDVLPTITKAVNKLLDKNEE